MDISFLNSIDISDVEQEDWGEDLCLLRLPGSNFGKNLLICVDVNTDKGDHPYIPLVYDNLPDLWKFNDLYVYDLRKNSSNFTSKEEILYYDLSKALEYHPYTNRYYVKLGKISLLRNKYLARFQDDEMNFLKKMLKTMIRFNNNRFDILTLKGTNCIMDTRSFYAILYRLLYFHNSKNSYSYRTYMGIYLYERRKSLKGTEDFRNTICDYVMLSPLAKDYRIVWIEENEEL